MTRATVAIPPPEDTTGLFSDEALAFVADLHRRFAGTRRELLDARERRQQQLDAGAPFHFLPETASIRYGTWQVPPPPPDLAAYLPEGFDIAEL